MAPKTPKTHSSNSHPLSSKPFFNKSSEGSFFSNSKETGQPFFSPSFVQPKLTIGQPHDKYENEANQVADQVVQGCRQARITNASRGSLNISPGTWSTRPIQTKCDACDQEEKLQRKEEEFSEINLLRKPIYESSENPSQEHIQRRTNASSDLQTSSLESRLSSSNGNGSPLTESVKSKMESGFESSFSDVKIHTDSNAIQLNNDLGAQAFTHGSNIYFNKGKFNTSSIEGKKLLAHELTHVVQQRGVSQNPSNLIQRSALPAECATISDPATFIVEQLEKKFRNENDPGLAIRILCLEEAFRLLSPKNTILLTQIILGQDSSFSVYRNFQKLATSSRRKLKQILADKLKRTDTATYIARIREPFAAALNSPTLTRTLVHDDKLVQVTLDNHLRVGGVADIFGNFDCEKYIFGFGQFVLAIEKIATYYNAKIPSAFVEDEGKLLKPNLPCQDNAKGESWYTKSKPDCPNREALSVFTDKPSAGFMTYKGLPDTYMTGLKLKYSFITMFSSKLPNGVIHHLKWFKWNMAYCETFDPPSSGQVLGRTSSKSPTVTIGTMNDGAPSHPVKDQVGKPASISCNKILKSTIAPFTPDTTTIDCS